MSNVTHPAHYNAGKIEVIEFIEDQKLNFSRGSVIKYTARAGKKDPTKEIEDLEKAVWYLNREIEVLRAAGTGRDPLRPNDMNPREERKLGAPPELAAPYGTPAPKSFKDFWDHRATLVPTWNAKDEKQKALTIWFNGADWARRTPVGTIDPLDLNRVERPGGDHPKSCACELCKAAR